MAIRPARKDPISTRPIYLPVVPSAGLSGLAAKPSASRTARSGAGIVLFSDLDAGAALDLAAVASLLGDGAGNVEALGDFFAGRLSVMSGTERRDAASAAANALAWARIRSASKQREYQMLPLRGEIDYEKARLHARLHPGFGSGGRDGGRYGADLVYDAAAVQDVYRGLLPKRQAAQMSAAVITDRRLATWDDSGGAWSPCTVLQGVPAVVTVSSPAAHAAEVADAIRAALS